MKDEQMNHHGKKVGITGNIGSGKTTVARVFETLGIPVFHADERAREIMTADEVIRQVVDLFGAHVLGKDGQIDRSRLAKLVFSDRASLERLNALIHPLVRNSYFQWHQEQQGAPYTLMEAAILFETGFASHMDHTILVVAPESLRIQRVCERDRVEASLVKDRMRNQQDQAELEKMADFVIANDHHQAVLPQVLHIDRVIRSTEPA